MSDDLHPAEIAKLEAEAERFIAEAEQARMEAEHARTMALGAAITAERENLSLSSERRKEATYLAGDFENRVYRFNDRVDSNSVDRAIDRLTTWDRLDPGCEVTIYLNSPGGDVVSGMALFDTIRDLARRHRIVTVGLGYAASMAGVLLQAGTERVMAKQSWLLLHQGSMLVGGSMGEVEDFFEWGKKQGERMVDIFYDRSQETDAPKKLSRKQIKARMDRRDWWIDADEALSHGLVDRVSS